MKNLWYVGGLLGVGALALWLYKAYSVKASESVNKITGLLPSLITDTLATTRSETVNKNLSDLSVIAKINPDLSGPALAEKYADAYGSGQVIDPATGQAYKIGPVPVVTRPIYRAI